jgi:hypothetical protein
MQTVRDKAAAAVKAETTIKYELECLIEEQEKRVVLLERPTRTFLQAAEVVAIAYDVLNPHASPQNKRNETGPSLTR